MTLYAPEACLSTDLLGVVHRANRASCELLGLGHERLHGKPLTVFVPLEDRRAFRSFVSTATAGETIRRRQRLVRRRGEAFEAGISVSRAPRSASLPQQLQWVIIDLTAWEGDRAREHVALREHAGRIGMLGEMAAALAHELGQPLAAALALLEGAVRRAESGALDFESLCDVLARATRQTERSAAIVTHLRAFARARPTTRTLIHDLNEVVRSAVDLASIGLDSTVTMQLDLSPGLPCVRGDHVQLEQVVVNLVANALEALGSPALIAHDLVVSTRIAGSAIEVRVTDTGPGFEGPAEKLFRAFYTSRSEGMGLGLAVSRSIIESHGGLIWARNRTSGAEVGFRIPAARETS